MPEAWKQIGLETKEYQGNEVVRFLSPIEREAGNKTFAQCIGLKKGENVMVVADTNTLLPAAVFFETAKDIVGRGNVRLLNMRPRSRHGEEPPEEVAKALLEADVLCLTTTMSLTHTEARKAATKNGARGFSTPGITLDLIQRTFRTDYNEIARITKVLGEALSGKSEIQVTSDAGTDLGFSIAGRRILQDTGIFTQPGQLGNLPGGEFFVAPVEGTGEGIMVIDGCSFVSSVPLDQPIRINLKDGLAIDVDGGLAARALVEVFEAVGPLARNLAEFGNGTNRGVSLASGLTVEVEKLLETSHFAWGNNTGMGGSISVPLHLDGVMMRPSWTADGIPFMTRGVFNPALLKV